MTEIDIQVVEMVSPEGRFEARVNLVDVSEAAGKGKRIGVAHGSTASEALRNAGELIVNEL